MKKLIEICDFSLGFYKDGKTSKIINNLNFHINEGEILGIAGASGCGKTLTALSIANLLPENARILSGKINYATDKISMIFQETKQSLNPLIKAGKQITESLELAGYKEKEHNKIKAMEILVSLGFKDAEKVFNSYPHRLSGGMCQRIIAAMAAIRNPRLLIADEPSSSLDEESQKCILSLLAKMNSDYKTTVLIISHDLSIIREFCSRFIVMKEGKIIKEELPEILEFKKQEKNILPVKNDSAPLLSVKNVSNRYILKNINMEIMQGEIFGLTGISGCGKTTLARCILGLIDYEGSVHLNNKKPKRGQMQMIFQEPGASLNPRKKIGWLMEEPLVINKAGNQQERRKQIDKMLLRVGLDPSYKQRRVHELSGGQKQRVCIGRALILKPDLLVADEPISSLDVHAQGQILKLFKKLNKTTGLTILFISHNKDAVEYLCERTVVMENGELKA